MKSIISSFPIVFCFFKGLIFRCNFGSEPCNLLKISPRLFQQTMSDVVLKYYTDDLSQTRLHFTKNSMGR